MFFWSYLLRVSLSSLLFFYSWHLLFFCSLLCSTCRPKFLFFSNGTEQVPEHYLRFLSKSLRAEFNMGGVPVRVKVVPKEKRGGMRGKRSQRRGKGSAR